MQELDAARRAAILRGRTPPPLPEEEPSKDPGARRVRDKDGRAHDRKRRKLAGEDDTDMDIRLAKAVTAPADDDEKNAKVMKLRSTTSDAPLTDDAGNINLFPMDVKETTKREKNAEAEKEKRRKEKALEDQYTMRFANAAGRDGLKQPWYTAQQNPSHDVGKEQDLAVYEGFVNKNVWGNEDPRRKDRELARLSTNDPFAFMQKAQAQLKKSKQDKKQWAEERERELRELRAAQEREDRQTSHHKRKRREKDESGDYSSRDADRSSKHNQRDRSQSRSRDKRLHTSSHRSGRQRSRNRSKDRDGDDTGRHPERRDKEHRTSQAEDNSQRRAHSRSWQSR
jgi:hypothetical protein